MLKWAKPVVVLSRCLEYEPVRYNAQVIPYDFVRQLEPWVTFVPVCPELEIGLGVPRDPIRIVSIDGDARLIQPTTDRDVTREMHQFSESFLASLGDVDGFLLKNRSPSCGIGDVKIHQGLSESASSQPSLPAISSRVLSAASCRADYGSIHAIVISPEDRPGRCQTADCRDQDE